MHVTKQIHGVTTSNSVPLRPDPLLAPLPPDPQGFLEVHCWAFRTLRPLSEFRRSTYRVKDAEVRARSIGHVTDHQPIWLATMLMNHDYICVVIVAR